MGKRSMNTMSDGMLIAKEESLNFISDKLNLSMGFAD